MRTAWLAAWSCPYDRASRLWFGTTNGATCFRPPAPSPPPVYIRAVVADQRYGEFDDIRIPASTGLTAFEFQSIDFKTRPGGMIFRYRLKGHDPEWRTTAERRVEYQDLPSSEYTFQVTAVDRDLNYSMPATVEIAVVPDSRDEKIDELEVRVRERTRELSGKNAELENTLAELREMQDQLIVQEKMASLGNLVAGLAHELNSPVGAIKSTADVSGRGLAKIGGLLEAVSRGEGSVERVQPILQLLQRNEEATTDAVGRLSRIVESLKTYTFAAWATILSGRRMPTIVPRSWLSGFVSRGSRSAHQKSLLSPASPMCWLSSLIARSRFRASQTRTDWKTTWWRLSQHGREEGERR